MLPIASVIVPAWNSERWLREAVESALAQTDEAGRPIPLEVIVCDDGSSVRQQLALEPFLAPDGPVRVVLQSHRGQAAARNAACRYAVAPWLAFLDADDRWFPGKLRAQFAAAIVHPDADVIYTGGVCIDEAGVRAENSMVWPGPVSGLSDLVAENRVPLSSAMVRASAFREAGGFDEVNVWGADDYELWLALADAGRRFVFVPQPLVEYRIHADQASADAKRMRSGAAYALTRTLLRGISPAERKAIVSRLAELVNAP